MAESLIRNKSFQFALKIIALSRRLQSDSEYVISKQVLKSGTSIGANVEEAYAAQSRRDFHSKMTIAFKEACETRYWLRLLQESGLVKDDLTGCLDDIQEMIRILTVITRKTKAPSS